MRVNPLPSLLRSCSSRAQVRGCLYNYTFHVIVTADEGGAVCVWNINNGQREGRFLKAHGDAKVRFRPSSPDEAVSSRIQHIMPSNAPALV